MLFLKYKLKTSVAVQEANANCDPRTSSVSSAASRLGDAYISLDSLCAEYAVLCFKLFHCARVVVFSVVPYTIPEDMIFGRVQRVPKAEGIEMQPIFLSRHIRAPGQ